MTATADGATNILRRQFPQFHRKPPAPRLVGDPIPDEARPALSLATCIGLLKSVMDRIVDEQGKDMLDIAINEARYQIK